MAGMLGGTTLSSRLGPGLLHSRPWAPTLTMTLTMTLHLPSLHCTLYSSRYEPQGVELLAHAFAAFPTKAYVLLTLPHTAREPPLLELMSRVPTKPGCSFPELLYLFTR